MSARIEYGLPIEDYHAIDAASSGRLRDMGRSPAYCRYRIDNPIHDTTAKIVGSFVDALLLAPDEAARFAPKDFDARTKDGKARRDELEGAGIRILAQPDYDRAMSIFHALQAFPWWADLPDVCAQSSVLWTDPENEIPCRARPDILADGGRILCDLKVCREAAQNVYPRRSVMLWHPQQLAWYARGLEEAGVHVEERYILAVHPDPPHEVTAYKMSAELNGWADGIVAERLGYYAECVKANNWPSGVPEVEIGLPNWITTPEVSFDGVEVENE